MLVSIIILAILVVIEGVLVVNLLRKIEKYEDITVDQTKYLQNISDTIRESQKHLKDLDEREVFKSDDEVGFFFDQMMLVQKELDKYMLPTNYGKKKE